MAIVTLYRGDKVSLESDEIVVPSDDVALLGSMVEQAAELQNLLGEEKSRIERAESAGYEVGYEKGQNDGYEAALEHIAVKLIAVGKEANAVREALEQQSGHLALKIVQKIATEIGSGPTIAALAASAAKQLVPREPITLRVSPANEQTVKDTVSGAVNTFKQIVEVSVDSALSDDDCVIETEFGQIKAGLDIQLSAFREKFSVV